MSLDKEYLIEMGIDAEWYYSPHHKKINSYNLSTNDFFLFKETVSNCQNCNLSETRTNVVFGGGDHNADIMFVGEAPGSEEDKLGIPFIGRAGKLLDEILFYLGVDRDKSFITNTVKCRPPENRNPKLNEISKCKHHLLKQINFINPKIIVLLGKVAANSILQNATSMNDMRKKIHKDNDYDVPFFVLYHPAYLLRSPLQKKNLWEDLKILENYIKNGYSTN